MFVDIKEMWGTKAQMDWLTRDVFYPHKRTVTGSFWKRNYVGHSMRQNNMNPFRTLQRTSQKNLMNQFQLPYRDAEKNPD